MEGAQTQDPIAELITNYNELNSSVIDELEEEPSPLEFMRYVAKNTPFVVRGAAADWQANRTWSVEYLKEFLGNETVNVAVTPFGNADAPTPYTHPDGTSTLVFAKPHEEDQPFTTFIDYLVSQEHSRPSSEPNTSRTNTIPPNPGRRGGGGEGEIRYAQTQNDNLRHEYARLFSHVPPTIPWARIALARDPDAINLWIGNSHSTTALHKDNYENVYVQVSGQKHFVLLPPVCHPCVKERRLAPGHYERRTGSTGVKGEEGRLELVMEEGEEEVPFAIWDPDRPRDNATRYSALAQPMRVTLEPGDMLYLPCMWYHKVSQSCSPEGVCIAVNYWYDMDFSGPLYPLSAFVRSVSNSQE
ncbi:hypothetical protein VTI74DRAFT_9416 [Chaetomium olivicolor]